MIFSFIRAADGPELPAIVAGQHRAPNRTRIG
jgi:hypothetical protein